MDQVTQQNAALVEEAAAASEAMQEQAAQLAQVVSVFELGTQTSNADVLLDSRSRSTRLAAPASKLRTLSVAGAGR
ncbi:MAG: methyl-accepting chemotaxis protein [Massilia sp.]|nr:methyl-accepting chemotaxis protein [Massilia sp.]